MLDFLKEKHPDIEHRTYKSPEGVEIHFFVKDRRVTTILAFNWDINRLMEYEKIWENMFKNSTVIKDCSSAEFWFQSVGLPLFTKAYGDFLQILTYNSDKSMVKVRVDLEGWRKSWAKLKGEE